MSTNLAFSVFMPSPDPFPDLTDNDNAHLPTGEDEPSVTGSEDTAGTDSMGEDLCPYIILDKGKCCYVFVARSQSRVCGNVGVDCHRPGHRAAVATRSPPGNYRGIEPACKGSPYNGDPGTWCLPVDEQRAANYADFAALATPQSSGSRPLSRESDTSSPSLIGAGVSYALATVVRGSVGVSEADYARPEGRQHSPAGVQFGGSVPIRSSILKKAPPTSAAAPSTMAPTRPPSPTVSQVWVEGMFARQDEASLIRILFETSRVRLRVPELSITLAALSTHPT
jgi:hypothetical protein